MKTLSSKLPDGQFYALLDTGYVAGDRLVAMARHLIAGGASLVQLRAKRETAAARAALVDHLLPVFAGTGVPLIINDDVALAARHPQLGVHVGQDDTPVAAVRALLGPDRIIGLSTHSVPQIEAALAIQDQLTYFAVGPVFATQTKPDYQPVGLDLVRYLATCYPRLRVPVFCIGGINRTNAPTVIAAGARNLVAVSDVLLDPDPAAAIEEYRRLLTPR
jgi:thiamine-phosphate pyrophosphorylase